VPLVVHFHGLDVSSSLRRNRWYRSSLVRALPEFAACIVVGSRQREVLLDLGVQPERIHLIPCGVPTEEFFPQEVPARNSVRFLTVGRLEPFKGVEEIIKAFALIRDRLAQTELVIVGDGSQSSYLQQMVNDLDIGGSVSFAGALPTDAVREQIAKADVFLQHSLESESGWFEGFGVTVAEASAMALAVIGSRCGGIMDQIVDGETGILVDQLDVSGLAAAMEKLAGNPELRAKLGAAARERVVEQFDASCQVERLEALLLSVADSNRK